MTRARMMSQKEKKISIATTEDETPPLVDPNHDLLESLTEMRF